MVSIKQPPLAEENRAQQTVATPMPNAEPGFNWRNCWYPVTFLQDLPTNQPYSFSLYDEPFILFRNQDGRLGCMTDRCPHRAARLSDGQIINGKIECLYHGWQFDTDGQCLHIPQLPADAKIPVNACVQSFKVVEHQGIVWIWAGEPEASDEKLIPTIADLENPEFIALDLVYDRPYDQTYFIENVLDPAHIPISHHGSDGNRQNAQPLEIEIIKTSVEGIQGRYRNTRKPDESWINLDFVAPNIVLYRAFDLPKPGNHNGLALYSIPLGKGRCRVLSRFYRNSSAWKIKLQPRWFSHWYRNRVIEEDIYISKGVQSQVEQLGQSLKELYLPLKTSDILAIEYRKWLDKFGSSLPFYQGYSTAKQANAHSEYPQKSVPLDRFSRHTLLCSSCNRAYQVTNNLKQVAVGVAIAMAAISIATKGFKIQLIAISAFVLAVSFMTVAEKFKTHFEHSYKRH